MRKKIFSLMSLILTVLICFTHINVYAKTIDSRGNIQPYYIAIIYNYNNLKMNTEGKLTCEGETVVREKYIAGVKMELQQLSTNNSWSTIKTWEETSVEEASLYKNWYIEKGSYRLKLTHSSMDSYGKTLETYIEYSKTIVY